MNRYYFNQHVKRQHMGNNSASFVCHKCFVRKPNEYLLKKHMQQHIESICVICNKKFNAKKDLKRHMKTHEVQRCEDCGKSFGSKKQFLRSTNYPWGSPRPEGLLKSFLNLPTLSFTLSVTKTSLPTGALRWTNPDSCKGRILKPRVSTVSTLLEEHHRADLEDPGIFKRKMLIFFCFRM